MPITAKLQYLHIAPRKVRLVADLIRRKKLEEAKTILNFTTKKASLPLLKLLKQAEANAQNNFQLDSSNLFISKITIDEGRKYKRWEPRARGQTYEIQKKTSHVKIVLDEIVKKPTVLTQPSVPTQPRKAKEIKKISPKLIKEEKTEERIFKPEKPKFKPEKEIVKPKTVKGLRKIFQRKVF